jgi:hypothetical protein
MVFSWGFIYLIINSRIMSKMHDIIRLIENADWGVKDYRIPLTRHPIYTVLCRSTRSRDAKTPRPTVRFRRENIALLRLCENMHRLLTVNCSRSVKIMFLILSPSIKPMFKTGFLTVRCSVFLNRTNTCQNYRGIAGIISGGASVAEKFASGNLFALIDEYEIKQCRLTG